MASPAEDLAGIAGVELALAQAVLDNVTNDLQRAINWILDNPGVVPPPRPRPQPRPPVVPVPRPGPIPDRPGPIPDRRRSSMSPILALLDGEDANHRNQLHDFVLQQQRLQQTDVVACEAWIQRVINDEMPLPAFPVCMCLMLLAKQKRTSLPDEFLMLCCNKLSRFESLTSGHPELHGTTLLNRYAACGIGACAYIMAKQPASGRAFDSQERFDMFFQILPKLIRSQFFDAAELVINLVSKFCTSPPKIDSMLSFIEANFPVVLGSRQLSRAVASFSASVSQSCIQNVEENAEMWTDVARKCLKLCFRIFVSKQDSAHSGQDFHGPSSSVLSADEVKESFFAPVEVIYRSSRNPEALTEYRALLEQLSSDEACQLALRHLTDPEMCANYTPQLAQEFRTIRTRRLEKLTRFMESISTGSSDAAPQQQVLKTVETLLSHPVFAPLVFECNTDADDMHFAHYWMSTISRVASENGVSFGRDAANVFKRALSQPDLRPPATAPATTPATAPPLLLRNMSGGAGGQVADELVARMEWSAERRAELTFLECTPLGNNFVKPGRWAREDIVSWIGADLEGDEKNKAVETMMFLKTAPAPAPATAPPATAPACTNRYQVFDALLDAAVSVESSDDFWTFTDIFFDSFSTEQDIPACFGALQRLQTHGGVGFDAKVAMRLESFLFRLTEATAFMVGDAVRHETQECRAETSNRIFNGVLAAAFQVKVRQERTPVASDATGTCVELLSSAYEKCVECASVDGQAQPLLCTQTEENVGIAAESISAAVFKAHRELCFKRVDLLVNFIASLHSQSNPQLAFLQKLLRNIAIDGRYRSIIELLASSQQPLHLDSNDVSVADVIWHICRLDCISNHDPNILKIADQNRHQSKVLLATKDLGQEWNLMRSSATLLKDIVTASSKDALLNRYQQTVSDAHESEGVRATIQSFASGHSLEQMIQRSFAEMQQLFVDASEDSDKLGSIANDMLQSHFIDAVTDFLSHAPGSCLSLSTRRRLFRDFFLVPMDEKLSATNVLSKVLSAITTARAGAHSLNHSETELHVSVKRVLSLDSSRSKRFKSFCSGLNRCLKSDNHRPTQRQSIARYLRPSMRVPEPHGSDHDSDDGPGDDDAPQHDDDVFRHRYHPGAAVQYPHQQHHMEDQGSGDDDHAPDDGDQHVPDFLERILRDHPELMDDHDFLDRMMMERRHRGHHFHQPHHRGHFGHYGHASQVNLVLWRAGTASSSRIDGDALHGRSIRVDTTSAQVFRDTCIAIDTGIEQFLSCDSRSGGNCKTSEISDDQIDKLRSAPVTPVVRKWLCEMTASSSSSPSEHGGASVPILEHAVEVQRGMTLQQCVDAIRQLFPDTQSSQPRATPCYALVFGKSLGAKKLPPPLPWTLEHVLLHLDAQLPRLHVIEELVSADRSTHAPPPLSGLSPLELSLALNRRQILDWYDRMHHVTGSHSMLLPTAPTVALHQHVESPTVASKCDRLIDILLQPCFSQAYFSSLFDTFNRDELCFLKDWKKIRTKFGTTPAEQHITTAKILLVKIHTDKFNQTQKAFDTMKKIYLKRLDLSALLCRPAERLRDDNRGITMLASSQFGQGATIADVKLMMQFFTKEGVTKEGVVKEVTAFAADADHDGATPIFFTALAQAFIELENMWLPCCLIDHSLLNPNSESRESPARSPIEFPSPISPRPAVSTAVGGGQPSASAPSTPSRASKLVHERGLFPRLLLPNSSCGPAFHNLLDNFRLFGFCVGLALRDHRKFPVCISVAFADAICGRRLTLWDVMIGRFEFHPVQKQIFDIHEFLSNGLKFGTNVDGDFIGDISTERDFHDIPDMSLLFPSSSAQVQNELPLHMFCPSSTRFEAMRMSRTAEGCLLHMSPEDTAKFSNEAQKVAISGASLPAGMHRLAVYTAKKSASGIIIDFQAPSDHSGALTVHLLSGYTSPDRQLREEYFAAIETAILQVGVQQQVDCVRQGISEVFPLAKLNRLNGLDLIDILGANPKIEDDDWHRMIRAMRSLTGEMDVVRRLYQDTLGLVQNSKQGDDVVDDLVLFGSKVKVDKFRREFCKAIFGAPQVDLSKTITFSTIVRRDGVAFCDNCHQNLEMRASRSPLLFKASVTSRAATSRDIIIDGAAQLQLRFKSHPEVKLLQGNRDAAARVSIYVRGKLVASQDQVAEGQTVLINGNEATLQVPEGCIYCMQVVPLYDESMPPEQKEKLCHGLLEHIWECIWNANASTMTDH